MGKSKDEGSPKVSMRVLYEDLDRLERLAEFYSLSVSDVARLAMRSGLATLETDGQEFWRKLSAEQRARGK
jgi:hypothetical protein